MVPYLVHLYLTYIDFKGLYNLGSLTGDSYFFIGSERGTLFFIGSRKTTNHAPIEGQSVGFSFYIAFHTVTEPVCKREKKKNGEVRENIC